METIFLLTYLTCEAIAFVFCVFGNLMICYVVLFKIKLDSFSLSKRFILSVSVADLLIGLVAIPYGIVKVEFPGLSHNFLMILISGFDRSTS